MGSGGDMDSGGDLGSGGVMVASGRVQQVDPMADIVMRTRLRIE